MVIETVPVEGVLAIENGTTAAARLVTRCERDILGQRGRGDDHGGPEGDHTPGVFSEAQVDAGDCQGVAPWPGGDPQGHL